jgi:hypothetical protein
LTELFKRAREAERLVLASTSIARLTSPAVPPDWVL